MTAPAAVVALVEKFDRHRESYESSTYNETQLRREFLDPMFEALGWDVQNRQGAAEAYKDVIHEDAIKVGEFTKAPDYGFRIGGTRKFFVEAKKPSKKLKVDAEAAFQLRRYAWSAKLPLSILTDFQEFAVYDTRLKPSPKDKASVGRVLYFTYAEYAEKWDEIAAIFSQDAVRQGAFDKFAEAKRPRRGTTAVDEAFLKDIEGWREALAKNIAVRNRRLDVREINFAVQRIIDRIIFLRIAEDRGIEPYGRLEALLNGKNVYARLVELFEQADGRYNSGLFHFKGDKGRTEQPDELTPGLKVDDEVLQDAIEDLYPPKSPYAFSVISADILGAVYEQFLGKVIRFTAGHHVKVEEKPEVRKAGGVYYTPTYIVEYIVKHTVGKLLEGKTLKQAAGLKVLDPACGSGSFLIGAYQRLLEWHRDWYVNDGVEKHRKVLYQGMGGEWRLTTKERTRILLNNIFGVDIDPQAVEVTKLSLVLKVLEGGSPDVLQREFWAAHERVLPDLGNNIKCGNSLIGPEFYEGQLDLGDVEDRHRINAFDWAAEFPAVARSAKPGFHAVIGNPPWGATFMEDELEYLRGRYERVVARMIDSYIYFVAKGVELASLDGVVGYIIPGTLLNQVDAAPARRLLFDRGLHVLVNLGQGVFGPKVLNTSALVVSGSQTASGRLIVGDLSKMAANNRRHALAHLADGSWERWAQTVKTDPHLTFFTGDNRAAEVLRRMRARHPALAATLDGGIERGVTPDVAEAHALARGGKDAKRLEPELLRPSVSGDQVRGYRSWKVDQFLLYTTRETAIQDFPRCLEHMKRFRHKITCKEVAAGKHPWWALHRPRDPAIFKSPKFIGLTTSKKIELIFDPDSSAFVTDAMYVFRAPPEVDPSVLMGVLQSRAFLFLYRVANQGEARVIPQVKASKLQELPVPTLTGDRFLDVRERLRIAVEAMYQFAREIDIAKTEHQRVVVQRQASSTEHQIDRIAYELYGLTDEEIRIVEEATP